MFEWPDSEAPSRAENGNLARTETADIFKADPAGLDALSAAVSR
jgi:hypothetical protein